MMKIPFFGLFVFILFLYLELSAFSAFSHGFGGFAVFLEIIASFLLGKYVGRGVIDDFKSGVLMPEAILSLLGALLLMMPGLVTDGFGLLLSISFIREKLNPHFTRSGAMNYTRDTFFKDRFYQEDERNKPYGAPIIDGDFREVDEKKKEDKEK